LFRNRQELLIGKRAAVLALLLSFFPHIHADIGWRALYGLFAGTALGILRYVTYALVLRKLVCNAAVSHKRAVTAGISAFAANQLLILPLLLFCHSVHPSLFWGFVCGIFTVPTTVMVNSVTEALGIIKSNFE